MLPKVGKNEPMSIATLEHDARIFARQLEDTERRRKGLTRQQAREGVARKLSVPVGTLEGISKGRVKNPDRLFGLLNRLRRAVVDDLDEEIKRLTHERDLLLAAGEGVASDKVVQAEAHIREAKALLRGEA